MHIIDYDLYNPYSAMSFKHGILFLYVHAHGTAHNAYLFYCGYDLFIILKNWKIIRILKSAHTSAVDSKFHSILIQFFPSVYPFPRLVQCLVFVSLSSRCCIDMSSLDRSPGSGGYHSRSGNHRDIVSNN